jgi:hypothetical protein
VLKLARQFKLEDKDQAYAVKAGYLPTIPILLDLARWREGLTDDETFQQRFQENRNAVPGSSAYQERFTAFCQTIGALLPEKAMKRQK